MLQQTQKCHVLQCLNHRCEAYPQSFGHNTIGYLLTRSEFIQKDHLTDVVVGFTGQVDLKDWFFSGVDFQILSP